MIRFQVDGIDSQLGFGSSEFMPLLLTEGVFDRDKWAWHERNAVRHERFLLRGTREVLAHAPSFSFIHIICILLLNA